MNRGAIKAPHNIVFLIYKSVIRNSVVPLPVCSGADWRTISDLLKPYLCNGSLRGLPNLRLVTFPTLQRSVPPSPIRENVRSLPRPQHNLILTGMFLSASCFWEEGDHYRSLLKVNRWLHSLSNVQIVWVPVWNFLDALWLLNHRRYVCSDFIGS